MRKTVFAAVLMLMGFTGHLGAQFYSYPQTIFGLQGVYSFRFTNTAFLFEDDLDRMFYPVKLNEVEGGRIFTAFSNPFRNEFMFDPTRPTNGQLVLGAKTNLPFNVSPLLFMSDSGGSFAKSVDTVHYANKDSDPEYEGRKEVKDSLYSKDAVGSKSFLLSLGSGDENAAFGILFMYSNMGRTTIPANFHYISKDYDYTSTGDTIEWDTSGSRTINASSNVFLLAPSLRFGKASGMLFLGFVSFTTKDTGNFSGIHRYRNGPFNVATEEEWNSKRWSNTGASGPLFGFQGDLGLGGETWRGNITFSYVASVYGNKNAALTYEVKDSTYKNLNTSHTYTRHDTVYTKYSLSGMTHDVNLYWRNLYRLHEQVLFGIGLGLNLNLNLQNLKDVERLNKRVSFNDLNGNGSIDPGDTRTTTITKATYQQKVDRMMFAYYVPVGLEITPVSTWENFKLRAGAFYRRTSITNTTTTYDHTVEDKSVTETAGGTTESINNISVPGDNEVKTKDGYSSTVFTYGASWTVAERVVVDFTGFGFGLLVPANWRISIVVKY